MEGKQIGSWSVGWAYCATEIFDDVMMWMARVEVEENNKERERERERRTVGEEVGVERWREWTTARKQKGTKGRLTCDEMSPSEINNSGSDF